MQNDLVKHISVILKSIMTVKTKIA